MRKRFNKIKVFVASPGDLNKERNCLQKIIEELNQSVAAERRTVLELVRWETHSWPGVGADAQDVINKQIGPSDIFIGIMWRKFGTRTKRAPSGTIEEFDRAYESWKRFKRPDIMFYFKCTPFWPSSINELAELRKVLEFKRKLGQRGLYWEFTKGASEFREIVRKHLANRLLSDSDRNWVPDSIAVSGENAIWTGENGEQRLERVETDLESAKLFRFGARRESISILWTKPIPVGPNRPSSSLIIAFTRNLRESWRYHFGGETPFTGQATYKFHIHDAKLFNVHKQRLWLFLYFDHPYFSSAVVVLDKAGKEAKRFWHPGHLRTILQLDEELFVVEGFNNVRGLPGFPEPKVQHPHPPAIFAVRFSGLHGVARFNEPLEEHFAWYYIFPDVNCKIEKFEVRKGETYLEVDRGRFYFIDRAGAITKSGNLEDKQPPTDFQPVRIFPL